MTEILEILNDSTSSSLKILRRINKKEKEFSLIISESRNDVYMINAQNKTLFNHIFLSCLASSLFGSYHMYEVMY